MITLFDKKGLQVTPALFELTDKILVCENTWMDVVPQRAIIDTAKVSIDWADTQKDYYIINKKDLINSRDDRVRVDGCCGADGTNLNIASKNDLPIGYEHADCYMPHFVRIPKQNVDVKISEDTSAPLWLFAITESEGSKMFVERIIADSYDDASKLEKLAEKRISSFTQDKIVRRLLLDKMYYAELGQLRYMVEDPHDPQLLWFNA